MQALQRTIDSIRAGLGSLTTNARLLIGSIMIILVMALLLVSQYAGRADYAPLGLPNTAAVREAASRHLRTMNVNFEDRGDDLYVPASRQYEVIGQLNERNIVSTADIDFNALIERNANPFIGRDQARQNWLTAKMNVLSAMIAARSDVSMARVIIDVPPRTPGIGSAYVPARASVTVKMHGAELTQEIADVFGRMVAGAQAGLRVEDVVVADVSSNRSFVPRGGDSMASSSYLEHKNKTEQHFRRMIQEAVNIGGTIVSVNAVVKNTRVSSKETSFDDPKIGPLRSESRDFNARNDMRSGEPGVRVNAGAAIAARSGRESEVSESVSREQSRTVFGGIDRLTEDPTGYPIEVNAVVSVPRSYFVRVFRSLQGDADAEPDATELDQIFMRKKTELESSLAILVRTGGLNDAEPGEVVVRMYDDFDPARTDSAMAATFVRNDGTGGVVMGDSMLKNIMLGGLALVSLLMMFLMVRRAGAREPLPSAEELVGIPRALEAAEDEIVGEVEEGAAVLDGVELADASMRTQQLLDQINEMIADDPADTANLLQRWIGALR